MRFRSVKSAVFVVIALFLVGAATALVFAKENSGDKSLRPLLWPVSEREAKKYLEPGYSKSLEAIVSEELEGTKGTYAVVIRNMKSGENYELNAERVFTSASLYKLWVMGAVYKEVEKGEIDLTNQINEEVAGLNEYFGIAPDVAELTEGAVNLTVESTINQMITISHNYAAMALVKKVGYAEIRAFLQEYGFTKTTVGNGPTTTALDIADFFDKLYRGELVSTGASLAMLDTLAHQEKKDVLPALLPGGVRIAHKTGELGEFKHDGGIVFSEKGDYVIVLMSESESPPGAIDRMSKISKRVYDYFSR